MFCYFSIADGEKGGTITVGDFVGGAKEGNASNFKATTFIPVSAAVQVASLQIVLLVLHSHSFILIRVGSVSSIRHSSGLTF